MPDTRFPGPYAGIKSIAFGREGQAAQPVDQATPLPVRIQSRPRPTYRSGVVGFTPVATATDIAALVPASFARVAYVEQITISGTATAGAVIDVLIQRSIEGGLPTYVSQPAARLDTRDRAPIWSLFTFSGNRTANGNGVSATRPILAAGKLYLGTAALPTRPLTFQFEGDKRPLLHDLFEWIVINLNGQAIPAGTSLDIFVEWSEEAMPPVQFAGDSTTSNATFMWDMLGHSGNLTAAANLFNAGCNGFRLQDALLATNGIPYPLIGPAASFPVAARLGGVPSAMVLCYGLNDLRQGAVSRADLIAMIDAAIYATLNGTTQGATYTSPMGSGTTFTWPATCAANPDARIILWGPNSLASDGNGAGLVALTGRFAAMPLAQAAQTVTDDLYFAYDAFVGDPRVFRVVQKQDIFGRTCRTITESGLMTDILHPNARGQVLSARQIAPHVLDAVVAATSQSL